MDEQLLWTPRQAAKALAISERTLWQLTRQGRIPHVVMTGDKHRTVRYPRDLLVQWVVECQTATPDGEAER
ncbi:MAG: helix-turn-helix domain-containing protein [Thermogutta sp.]|nr:helix-turn-helix domain-containing protein [Thermogutta sp.]